MSIFLEPDSKKQMFGVSVWSRTSSRLQRKVKSSHKDLVGDLVGSCNIIFFSFFFLIHFYKKFQIRFFQILFHNFFWWNISPSFFQTPFFLFITFSEFFIDIHFFGYLWGRRGRGLLPKMDVLIKKYGVDKKKLVLYSSVFRGHWGWFLTRY